MNIRATIVVHRFIEERQQCCQKGWVDSESKKHDGLHVEIIKRISLSVAWPDGPVSSAHLRGRLILPASSKTFVYSSRIDSWWSRIISFSLLHESPSAVVKSIHWYTTSDDESVSKSHWKGHNRKMFPIFSITY